MVFASVACPRGLRVRGKRHPEVVAVDLGVSVEQMHRSEETCEMLQHLLHGHDFEPVRRLVQDVGVLVATPMHCQYGTRVAGPISSMAARSIRLHSATALPSDIAELG